MTWRRDKLPELVRAMSGRPRHEALSGHVTELLREGFTLPIPEYDDTELLHRDLAAAANRAETVAATVPLTDAQHFTAKRRAIRAALAQDGIAAEIEALVDALLPP